MGYTSWHNYGYGICVDDIACQDCKRLEQLLALAPEFGARLHAWLSRSGITEPAWDDYMEYDREFCLGLATILKEVMAEAEGIGFTACDSYSGNSYVLYQPKYPWQIGAAEQELTEEKLRIIFARYVNVLTDDVIEIRAYEVGNGG